MKSTSATIQNGGFPQARIRNIPGVEIICERCPSNDTVIFAPLKSRGFALVVTLSLMVLLTLVAVGLLSLSAVSMRTSSQTQAEAEAKANARLALMIAIGELQKQMGPDQRISANGAMLDTLKPDGSVQEAAKNPHWTGVWDSWIAGAKASAVLNSAYPSAESHHQTIGNQPDNSMRPEYAQKDKYFRQWLVSLPPGDAVKAVSAKDLVVDGKNFPGKNDTAIRLVGSASSSSTDYVSARLIDTTSPKGGKGRYGWWVGDESQKARVLNDSYVSKPPANSAEKIFRGQSPASTGTSNIKGLENLTNDGQLASLPSLASLNLVSGVTGLPAKENFHHVTPYSCQVLADVREGGLKRDLSTILEQPIVRTNTGPEYMLYEFDDPRFPSDRSNSRVPIQDLAAYYQLYNDIKPTETGYGVNGREGVRYTSTQLPSSIQTNVPDYDGGTKDRQRYLREYTTLYRQPVLTKLQFILGVSSEAIAPAERTRIKSKVGGSWENDPTMEINADDDYKLIMGIKPMVTLWNPTNLPMVMADTQVLRFKNPPPVIVKWRKYDGGAGNIYDTNKAFGLTFLTAGQQIWQLDGRDGGYDFMDLHLQGSGGSPVVFGPGEVKIFTLADSLTAAGVATGINTNGQSLIPTVNTSYNPKRFLKLWHSSTYSKTPPYNPHVYVFTDDAGKNRKSCLVFNASDRFSLSVDSDKTFGSYANPESVACDAILTGSAFAFSLVDNAYYSADTRYTPTFLEHYAMLSRHGGRKNQNDEPIHTRMASFNKELLAPGFPGGKTPLDFRVWTNAIQGDQIIGAGNNGDFLGLFDFSLSLGCELSSLSAAGLGGGRRIAIRPFLHSGAGAPPFIDQSTKDWLYTYGLDWQVERPNNIPDSIVRGFEGTDNGFFGGGYTIEDGTTRVIQREIPVLPLISMAALSHAQLGGHSLAYAVNYDGIDPATGMIDAWTNSGQMSMPKGVDFQKVTATGQGGLAPQVMQAIGNSYAHPNIPADKAFTTKTRRFDEDEGGKVVPFVDHSYLANKALWDEFFFSSIAPQPAKVPLFGTSNPTRTTKEVADAFFKLNEPLSSSPLPNRRIKPYITNLNQSKFDTLFSPAENIYTNGLADKIAAHLMVEGAFNVNSTSVEAWKVFLSSLKGKPVAYLDGGTVPKEATPEGTSISPGSLPNGTPVKSDDITDINDPKEQWTSGRELTDAEIEQLATAMVKQVKLRGPFLSMSEFINRRLDLANTQDMALKGALQAALDDPAVSINAKFRSSGRTLDAEMSAVDPVTNKPNRDAFAFGAAADGPIAYGSQPYVDQADVLRGFAEQLTPRGDTFIIRTYGDSLDASGQVVARAWCEAVVQRVPEYVNAADEPHLKQADPALSAQSKQFGRKIQIISFRWVNPSEI